LSPASAPGARAPGPLAVALAAAAVFALAFGMRQSQALFIGPINSHTGIGYAAISLAIGIGQLLWGVTQPFAGAAAHRWGPRKVMIGGVLLLAAANMATPFAGNAALLILSMGVLAPLGAGTIGAGMLVSAASRLIPEAKRSIASGIINAGGSFGQFTLVPLAQLLIGLAGWQPAMVMLGLAGLAAVPLLLFFAPGAPAPAPAGTAAGGTLGAALRGAARDPSFLLLNAGFFTCGFHVAFIATHLPGVVALCGLPAAVGAWSISIIGLFNMLGSLWIGRAIHGRRMKLALAWLYFVRAALILAFFLAPKTPAVFFLFAAGVGFTYLSTVPPTIGLVGKLLGTRYLAMLFGVVMLSHQVGAFLGAWLGGKAFEATGSYDLLWWADIVLCLFAAAVHLPIREARSAPALAPASA
jgi:predicted MFS family arabinose efflux permease